MKIATVRFIAAFAVTIQMVGCTALNPAGQSSFSCPGMPQGVTCKSPTAVYKSTNGALPETENDRPLDSFKSEGQSGASKSQPLKKLKELSAREVEVPRQVKTPLPVRASAQVMRIWIAPWTDRNDDLHMPSFIYTEVQARKWNLGQAEFIGNGVPVPHRLIDLSPAQSGGAVPSTKSGRNQEAPNPSAVTPQPQDDLNLGE